MSSGILENLGRLIDAAQPLGHLTIKYHGASTTVRQRGAAWGARIAVFEGQPEGQTVMESLDSPDRPSIHSDDPGTEDFGRALERAKFGDSSGFRFIYRKFNRTISALVRSDGSPNPDQTVNAVFHKAFQSIDRFVGSEANFASFLYQIAHFQCIDDLRAHNRRVPISEVSEGRLPSGDVDAAKSSVATRARNALGLLTSEQREVVVLRVFFGLTGPDTAFAMEKPIADIRALQNRAEHRLQAFAGSGISES